VSPRIKHESTTTTTTTTTQTTTEETTIKSSTESVDVTTKVTEHENNMIISTESPSSTMMMMEEHNQTIKDYSSSTLESITSTITSTEEMTSTKSEFDYTTTNQGKTEEQNYYTTVSTNKTEEEIPTSSSHSRLFHLLANLSQYITTENPITESTFRDFNSTIIETNATSKMILKLFQKKNHLFILASSSSLNPCTSENLRANFVYHEYSLDKHKFIFCDSEGKMNVIACSPNYIWSQNEQSCILPN
jgi:hypothetical protein